MALTGQIAEAFVDIKANTKNYEQGLGKVKSSLGGLKGAAMLAGKAIGVAGLGFAAVKGIKAVASAYLDEEKAVAKLNAVLKATGNAAGISAKGLQEIAQELQNTTTFSNDAIINTQAVLATFKNIKGDEFKEATEAILDMSVVLDQDAKQGAIQLGKALNDPIRGVTALNRVGVTFTTAQREQIKVLQEAGDMMGAQRIILEELKSEFGGAAAAARDTFGGALKGLQNDLMDLGKAMIGAFEGAGLVEAINFIAEKLRWLAGVMKQTADTTPWKRFVAFLRFHFKSLIFVLKAPWVILIAVLRDVWEALKINIAEPLARLFETLGKFSNKMAGLAEEMAKAFADKLPNGMQHTKKAIKDLANESKANREEFGKAWVDAGNISGKETDSIIKNEKAQQEEIKKTTKAKKAANFTGAAGILQLAQAAATADAKLKRADIGVPTTSDVSPMSQKTAGFKQSSSETIGVLNKILSEIKSGNSTLKTISNNTKEFSVFA